MEEINNLKRDSILIYRSFYEATKDLPDKEFSELFRALFDYGLNNAISTLSGEKNRLFIAFKPQIDANNLKYIKGLKT